MLDYQTALQKVLSDLLDKQESGRLPIILIDGQAASGKSQFAKDLSELYFQSEKQAARVIQMDDLYPGWDGLAEGSVYLLTHILTPLSQGKTASWQIWNWQKSERGAQDNVNGRREFSGGTALIIEGCGSISRLSSELADVTIWIEAAAEERKKRFNLRDAGRFDEYFGIWSAQEDEFYDRENSKQLAQLIVQN
jgi:uridine kinase